MAGYYSRSAMLRNCSVDSEQKTAIHNPMKRLAIFCTAGNGLWDWDRIGTLRRETAVYSRFAQAGWKATFYTYDTVRKLPPLDYNMSAVPQWPFLLPERLGFIYQAFLPLLHFFKGRKTSVVICVQAHGGWPAVIAGRLWGAKVVARCGMVYGESMETLGKSDRHHARKRIRMERWTFRHADVCVVPTAELAEWIQDKYGVDRRKVVVIPNFVDCDLFRPIESTDKSFDIVSIGRLVPKKRHDLLLNALKGTNLRLHIIGAGKMKEELLLLAESLNVSLKVSERIDNEAMPDEFSRAHMYVNVSQWEGHPKAMIEAMACGLPCVGADVPGINNMLTHNENGIIVAPDETAIRTAIQALMSDKARRQQIGANARQLAIERYSLTTVFEMYNRLVESLQTD
jgi:glycosyltransferase involved in cell wall biosynthesis